MKRISAFVAFTLTLVIGASGLAATPAFAAPADDVATVIDRLEEYYLSQGDDIIIANGIYLARSSEALDYVASQKPDGSWADVNYADRTSSANGSVWSAYTALYRMLAMTQAYKDPTSSAYGDERLVGAVERALLYWDGANPGNTNWWETEIGESIAMGRISMFLGDQLSPEAFAVSLKHNTGKLDPVGANGAWRTSNYLFEALSTRDLDKVKEGFATIVATIAVDHSGTVQEAVQPDGSFWAHGAQLYSEGYGMVLFTYAALWADVARGTSLAFARDQLDAIAFYFIGGTRWLIRGEIGMLYLNYRPPKTVKDVTSHASEFIEPIERMVRTDALYSAAYKAVLEGIMGTTETNGVTGNKYFWRSEFSSHLRDDFGIFTRLNSSRTFGAELRTPYRDELGNPVYWNAMGSTAIQVNNHEYLDLGPAFDWWHYPGVTAPDVKRTERGVENRGRNGDGGSFTGGTSNGEYGVSVITLDTAGTGAQKSFFMFDEGMVALGAGIVSTSGASVHTTINQTSARDNATVGGQDVAPGTDAQDVGSASWAYNDEVGYVFAAGQNVKVSNKTRSGNWDGEETLSRDAFSLYVDHGVKPSASTYDYTVLPAATPAEVEAYAVRPAVRTLRNDTSVQAVSHDGIGLTMATFYQAGSLDLGAGRTLKVDQPSIVLLDERGDTPVVSISNPDRPGLVVSVSLTGGGDKWNGSFALGAGENQGKTVTASLAAGDLAVPTTFDASSTASGSSVTSLGDGDRDSEWRSAAGGTQWVSTKLARGSWVTKVTVDWGDEFASDFVVQTSSNGANWTDQAHITTGSGGLAEIPINPTPAEHVRIVLLNGGAGAYGIRELAVASSVNLSIDSATRASGYAGYNLVNALADGDPNTRWRGNNANTAWAQVDLGESKPISTVRLSWEAAFAKAYKIQLSDDGATWRDAYVTPTAGSDGGIDVITLDGQSARFVRMQTVTRALDYGPSLWEFEIFSDRLIVDAPVIPSGKGNLALGKPTTADSFYNNVATVTAPKATDGSPSTKWSSARAATAHWLQVDLQGVTSISRAVVSWESGTSKDYRVEGSIDGTNWVPLARVTAAQPTLVHTHDFAPTDVRYVRLTGLPSTQYGLNIWEFELYGGYSLECTGPVSASIGGTSSVAAVVSPVAADDTFFAKSLNESVVTVSGDARASADGRVEIDIAGHNPGQTKIMIGHAGGSEVAWCDVMVVAETAQLRSQIDTANALDSSVYTPRSWATVIRALETAKGVIAAAGSTQGAVDNAASTLKSALAALVRRDAVPSLPRDVVATLASDGDGVDVKWATPETEGGSAVVAYEVTVGEQVLSVGGSVLSASVTGLEPGSYSVTVRAQNAGGWSSASEAVTVVIDAEVVPIVRVEGSPKAGAVIEVSGEGFESGTEYALQLRSVPVGLGTVIAEQDGTIEFRGVVPRDVVAGEHTVVVVLGETDIASTVVQILPADTPETPTVPSAPRDVVATASGDDLDVRWLTPETDGGSAVIAYEVTVGDRVVSVGGSVLSASVTGLEPGSYSVTVRAQNAGGWSAASGAVTVVIDPEVVAPVVRVEGSPKAGADIEVVGEWFEPGTEYALQLRSVPVDLGTVVAGQDGTIEFRGVVPRDVVAGEHTVVVVLGGVDIALTVVQILPADAPEIPTVPSAPRDVVAAVSAGGDGVDVKWATPETDGGSPVVAYEVTVGEQVVSVGGSVLSASVTGLEPGSYSVTVRAQNAGGWSAASGAVTVVIDPEVVAPVVRVEGSPKAGADIEVVGEWFEPGTEYALQLRSVPVDLGTVLAGHDGRIEFRGVVPRDVPAGEHTVVVILGGVDIASTIVQILPADPETPVDPEDPGTPVVPDPADDGNAHLGELPATGGDVTWIPRILSMAMLMIIFGAALRMRRRQTE